MRVVSRRTMTNDDAKHEYNAKELLSTKTMTNFIAKHKNNSNRAAKQENDDK